jgi:hypothetical protein
MVRIRYSERCRRKDRKKLRKKEAKNNKEKYY